MAKSRFSQTQILSILKQAQDGTSVTALCCDHRMSSAAFYQWRRKFGSQNATPGPIASQSTTAPTGTPSKVAT